MKWVCLTIRTKSEAVEAITYALTEIGIPSIEIEDPHDITIAMEKKNKTDWDYIDEDLLTSRNQEEVIIKAYISEDRVYEEKVIQVQEKLNYIREFLDIGIGTVQTQLMDEEEWANSWKKYYKPIKIGESVIIKPSWEEYIIADPNEVVIEMDPGMAFGTGTHETTSMCLQLLERYIHKGDVVFDIGCGSGILGITSAKLGAAQVTAVDLDANAVKVANENIQRNNVKDVMKVYEGNLLDAVTQRADVVVANIIADVIIELSKTISEFLKPNGLWIASGIIRERLEDVKESMNNNGFRIVDLQEKGEWCAVAAKMKE